MAVTAFNETVRVMVKHSFEDRSDQASYDFLSHPTSNRGNAKRSKFSFPFRNIRPSERNRHIGTSLEVSHKGVQILFEILLKHPDRNLVETGCAPILLNGFKSLLHQLRGDSPRKGMDFKFLGHYLHC
jgi:hypothetical protein